MEANSYGSKMKCAPPSSIRKIGKHGYLLYATDIVRDDALAIQVLSFLKSGFQDKFMFVN